MTNKERAKIRAAAEAAIRNRQAGAPWFDTANPQAVLALLDEIDRLHNEVDRLRDGSGQWNATTSMTVNLNDGTWTPFSDASRPDNYQVVQWMREDWLSPLWKCYADLAPATNMTGLFWRRWPYAEVIMVDNVAIPDGALPVIAPPTRQPHGTASFIHPWMSMVMTWSSGQMAAFGISVTNGGKKAGSTRPA